MNILIEQKKRLLEKLAVPTEDVLTEVYEIICYAEGLKPVRVCFDKGVNCGFYEVRTFEIFTMRFHYKHKIKIEPSTYWFIYLLHEITHQLLWVHFDVDSSKHGKIFDTLYNRIESIGGNIEIDTNSNFFIIKYLFTIVDISKIRKMPQLNN